MNITYYGATCFRLQNSKISILIDPPDNKTGLKLPRMQNDMVLFTHDKDGKISGQSFIINCPGEYEVKGSFVYGVGAKFGKDAKTMYLIEVEGIKIVHLGNIDDAKLNEDQLDKLDGVDVLMVPVGGGDSLDNKKAMEVVNSSKVNMASSWSSLTSIFSEGKNAVNQFQDNLDRLNENQELDDDTKTRLLEAVNKKLEDNKIDQLSFLENDNLKLFYPSSWFISEEAGIINLASYDLENNLLPDTRAGLEIIKYSNSESLSKEEWLINLENNSLAYSVETLTISSIESLKHVTDYPENNTQVNTYLVPLDNFMLVIRVDIVNSYLDDYYKIIIENIINSIIIK